MNEQLKEVIIHILHGILPFVGWVEDLVSTDNYDHRDRYLPHLLYNFECAWFNWKEYIKHKVGLHKEIALALLLLLLSLSSLERIGVHMVDSNSVLSSILSLTVFLFGQFKTENMISKWKPETIVIDDHATGKCTTRIMNERKKGSRLKFILILFSAALPFIGSITPEFVNIVNALITSILVLSYRQIIKR